MEEVMKYVCKYVKALVFISALICLILGTDISKVEESNTIGILLYCALFGTLLIWSAYYTYDFIKTFHKE